MSAVSKKLIPASRAASTTAAAPPAPVRHPKLLHPIPTRETSRDPSLRYSITALFRQIPGQAACLLLCYIGNFDCCCYSRHRSFGEYFRCRGSLRVAKSQPLTLSRLHRLFLSGRKRSHEEAIEAIHFCVPEPEFFNVAFDKLLSRYSTL